MNFDAVHGIFEELFGTSILPQYPLEDIDEPVVLDCGFGKGQWLESILNYTNSEAWVSERHGAAFVCQQRPKSVRDARLHGAV